ncbi:hypothetical protein N0V90_013538 [Kalmusia sp. IMI 367209]|nr:hypothetical protein N0V90_013538 [Kalmusia sp. IMI 367209]
MAQSTAQDQLKIADVATSPMVAVMIGREATTFSVHEKLLRSESDYFKASLRNDWVEGKNEMIILDDVKPKTFRVFVNWLYHREIMLDRDSRVNQTWTLIDVYILAERLRAEGLRCAVHNEVCDFLWEDSLDRSDYCAIVRFAFDNIKADRVILEFLVDLWCGYPHYTTYMEVDADSVALLPLAFMRRALHRFQYMLHHRGFDVSDECLMEHNGTFDCDRRHHPVWDEEKGVVLWSYLDNK